MPNESDYVKYAPKNRPNIVKAIFELDRWLWLEACYDGDTDLSIAAAKAAYPHWRKTLGALESVFGGPANLEKLKGEKADLEKRIAAIEKSIRGIP